MAIEDYFALPKPRPQGGGRPNASLVDRFWANVQKTEGCWIWTGTRIARGYGQIGFQGKMLLAHRIAYELEYGSIPKGLCVCHHCDTPACIRPDHLFAGTYKDNEDDKWQKGRGRRGSRHHNAKLAEQQVLDIRRERATNSLNALAAKYGVSKKLILGIVQRKFWKHI